MNQDPAIRTVILSVISLGLVRLLKSDWAKELFANAGVSIPKWLQPFIALGSGAGLALFQHLDAGGALRDSLIAVLIGINGGGLAIAANETMHPALRRVSPKAANVVFGKKASAA